jgi:hypothetical protein
MSTKRPEPATVYTRPSETRKTRGSSPSQRDTAVSAINQSPLGATASSRGVTFAIVAGVPSFGSGPS